MNQDPVTVRRIDWESVFPALLLFRAIRIACSVQVLAPSLLLVLLAEAGLNLSYSMKTVPRFDLNNEMSFLSQLPTAVREPLMMQWRLVTGESSSFFSELLVLSCWLMVVAVPGVAVARVASDAISNHGRTGVIGAARFSLSMVKSYSISIVICILMLCVISGINWIGGAIIDIPDIGEGLYSVVFPLAFIVACLTAIGSLVFCAAWFLGLAAIGTDSCDGADALSRGLSYSLSHPATTAFYLAVVFLISVVGFELAEVLISTAERILQGHTSESFVMEFSESVDGVTSLSQRIRFVWCRLVTHLPEALSGWGYSDWAESDLYATSAESRRHSIGRAGWWFMNRRQR